VACENISACKCVFFVRVGGCKRVEVGGGDNGVLMS